MANEEKPLLKKELGLLSVYALATGATLSSGFFILPGIAFSNAGPAMILSYMLAVLPLVPAMFSIVELGSAMPRAGGAYYFLDRTLGPLMGTIGGFGTWLALTFKTAFAMIGMGAYINLYLPKLEIIPAAAVFTVIFAIANLWGARKAGTLQVGLVAGLLVILLAFIARGLFHTNPANFSGFFDSGFNQLVGTTGLVYISYVGVTNVASVSEEVKNPERNLPLGVFMAVATAVLIYGLGTFVMVGVLPADQLKDNLTPVATAASFFAGPVGKMLATLAALLAFFAVANAGILSASRYPLAMSRDHLLPGFMRRLNSRGIPANGIFVTLGLALAIIFLLDPTHIAKVASAIQLVVFALLCLAVILMRESGLDSYDPGYRSPCYPWLHVAGILIPCWLLLQMGTLPLLFAAGLIVISTLWYWRYAYRKVVRHGAIFHVFERLGRQRFDGLDRELRGIMKEKGLRAEDPYDEVVVKADVLDIDEPTTFEEVTRRASRLLAQRLMVGEDKLAEGFFEGTRVGATPVSGGAALPHMRMHDLDTPAMVIARCAIGIHIDIEKSIDDEYSGDVPVHAVFFLVSPESDPARHLRVLSQIASHIDDDSFLGKWGDAQNEHELKEILLRDEHFVSFFIGLDHRTRDLVGHALKDVALPEDCLVALIRRGDRSLVPHGNSILEAGDRITVIGEPQGIGMLYERYLESHTGN
jgi:APA family basic amino acid/polyamine antiporter